MSTARKEVVMAGQGKELERTGREEGSRGLSRGLWSPQIDVSEQNGEVLVRAELPELERKDLTVDVKGGALTISGERRSNREESGEGYFYSEESFGSFSRRIRLPA